MLWTCNDQQSVDSSSLKERTLSILPAAVDNSGMSDRDKGPRIVSLVLVVCIWISFWSAQFRRFSVKAFILELWDFGSKTSDKVVSSTYLCTRHPVVRSLMNARNERRPSHDPWGIAPFSCFQDDVIWLARTLCRRFDKYEPMHLSKQLGMPYMLCNLSNNRLWFTRSNALRIALGWQITP